MGGSKMVVTKARQSGGYVIQLNDGSGCFFTNKRLDGKAALTDAAIILSYQAAINVHDSLPGSEIISIRKTVTTKLEEV
jgi:hypothetical protein